MIGLRRIYMLAMFAATMLLVFVAGANSVAGGTDDQGVPLSDAELYRTQQNMWTPTPSMRTSRTAATGTLLSNGAVLVAGGLNASGEFVASAELFRG